MARLNLSLFHCRPISVTAEYKFFNHHGERGARIHRWDSLNKASFRRYRPLFLVIVFRFFFNLPNTYMEKMEKIWIDKILDSEAAKQLIALFEETWRDSIIPVCSLCIIFIFMNHLSESTLLNIGYSHLINKCWFPSNIKYRYKPSQQKCSTNGSIHLFFVRVL